MKFICTKENLIQTLAIVSGLTTKNIQLPILNNVLIKAEDQKVEIVATNLELAIVVTVRSKVEEPGSFTVPARTLFDYINLLPNEKIDLEVKDNELLIACGKSSTKIKGSSAEDFPVIPSMEGGDGFVVEAALLKEALGQVLPAVAKNNIRPELAGIYFGFNVGGKQLTLAATDSYRLAEKKIPLQQGEKELKLVVPARTAQEIHHTLSSAGADGEKDARLLVGENQIILHYGNARIISRLVDGSYPDYTQIIPQTFQTTAVVDTAKISKEMKAAGLFTTSGVNAVTLLFKPALGTVSISSSSTQTGEYASEITAEIIGAELSALLNNRYVLDGLNNISTVETEIKIVNSDSPCIVAPKGDPSYVYLVMPIRQ